MGREPGVLVPEILDALLHEAPPAAAGAAHARDHQQHREDADAERDRDEHGDGQLDRGAEEGERLGGRGRDVVLDEEVGEHRGQRDAQQDQEHAHVGTFLRRGPSVATTLIRPRLFAPPRSRGRSRSG